MKETQRPPLPIPQSPPTGAEPKAQQPLAEESLPTRTFAASGIRRARETAVPLPRVS